MLIGIMLVAQDLSNAEYYFDHDPGYGNATSILISGDTDFIEETISSEDLNVGVHRFYIRLKDEDDRWGMDETIAFMVRQDNSITMEVDDPVSGIEFFIGDDPGVGNGEYIDLENGYTLAIEEWIESNNLSDGNHSISIRPQSELGVWGLREWTTSEYLTCSDIPIQLSGEAEFCFETGAEYTLPDSLDTWYWNSNETTQSIIIFEEGEIYGSAYDSINHICYLSDTIMSIGFNQPDPGFTYTGSFNTVDFLANDDNQSLFWQLNDEYDTDESNFSYTFQNDGWQAICLETTNVCGSVAYCDSLLICENFETPPHWYLDQDEDGFGNESDSLQACDVPIGYAALGGDCDDTDPDINPDGIEIENDGIDQNCDGEDIITGLIEMTANDFNVYPNPTRGLLNVSFKEGFSGEAQMYNMQGKLVFDAKVYDMTELQIDTESFGAGFYILRIFNQDQQALSRISVL